MIGFLYRSYTEARGVIYNGDENNLKFCINSKEAQDWYNANANRFEELTVIIPPNKPVKISVPIGYEGERDDSFETEVLKDIRIDPKSRVILNKLLQTHEFVSGGFFVKKSGSNHEKMHTKNMEVLQLMKDVILGYIRYEPIKLNYNIGKGAQKKQQEYDWDICEDFQGVEYRVGGVKHKTNIYGVYTRKLRKAMLKNEDSEGNKVFEFYGGHELQYFQRWYDLNYGAINYMCASRDSGKSYYSTWKQSAYMFKSPTLKREIADDANMNTYFFTPVESVIPEYALKLKKMFYSLMVDTYQLDPAIANQIIEWRASEFKMQLHTAQGDRSYLMYSERATTPRGTRAGIVNIDESNYLKNYEDISEFATKSGAQTVHNISTISRDSKSTAFYKGWVEAMIKTKNLRPIDEVIHHIWTKYGFDKITSREDYKKMVNDGIFDKAQSEYYTMRPVFGMKVTLDDVEYKSQQQKEVEIEKAINSPGGYDGMLAEYYCELPSESAAIKYKSNIMSATEVPRTFDKIYVGYDEADKFDGPGFVVGGVSGGKLYILDAMNLPSQLDERFAEMNKIGSFYQQKSLSPMSGVMDIMRGDAHFILTADKVKFIDRGIVTRTGKSEIVKSSSSVKYRSVGTEYLVENLMNVELIATDRLFLSTDLASEGGLFDQLDSYIKEKGSYKGRGQKKDDLVSALMYLCYYVYQDYFIDRKPEPLVVDRYQDHDVRFDIKQKMIAVSKNDKAKKSSLWNIW